MWLWVWGVIMLSTVFYLWQRLILLMSSDGIWCMRFFWGRKTLKTRILVSSQAVLHTNIATIGTQNREKQQNISEKKHSKEIQDHYFATFKKKGGKGELSSRFISWTQCKKHQSKEFVHKLHAANQEHITSPEVSKTSQSASIRCSKRPIKKGLQPSQSNTHHTEKRKDGRERERQRKEKYKRDAGGGASPHEKTQKNTYMMWRRERQREWTIHPNVQFL